MCCRPGLNSNERSVCQPTCLHDLASLGRVRIPSGLIGSGNCSLRPACEGRWRVRRNNARHGTGLWTTFWPNCGQLYPERWSETGKGRLKPKVASDARHPRPAPRAAGSRNAVRTWCAMPKSLAFRACLAPTGRRPRPEHPRAPDMRARWRAGPHPRRRGSNPCLTELPRTARATRSTGATPEALKTARGPTQLLGTITVVVQDASIAKTRPMQRQRNTNTTTHYEHNETITST